MNNIFWWLLMIVNIINASFALGRKDYPLALFSFGAFLVALKMMDNEGGK